MAEQESFCVEDTVCLKSNPYRIGVVDRTFSNVETHSPNPEQDTLDGVIACGENVDVQAFNAFIVSGVPPKGTVLVTWVLDDKQDGSNQDPIVIYESELELLDRALLFGDIVKRSSREAMSGTVIQASTTASLVQPLGDKRPQNDLRGYAERTFSLTPGEPPTFSTFIDQMIRDVPVEELKWANEYEREDLIIYNNWVGLIQEIEEDVYLCLSNNSVVVPEDCTELLGPGDLPCQINQAVVTRKANLRRGRWIYGAYDANIEPDGVVVDIRPRSLAVQWLASRYPKGGANVTPEPPPELERPELESGAIHVYDRRKIPDFTGDSSRAPLSHRRANLDVALGDRVRFRDLDKAAEKYKEGSETSGSSHKGTLNRLPRSKTLGFDVNVFMVMGIKTRVDVLWQDGTMTRDSPATELSPYLDLDNEEEVWPGEFVMTKEAAAADPTLVYFVPKRAGIVQTVNSSDRMARVRWFDTTFLEFTRDRPPWLLTGSYTSKVTGDAEDISLYDLFSTNDFARRLGDMVIIVPSPVIERAEEDVMGLKDVKEIMQADESVSDKRMWIGEVVELGLDGLLTVRLGACEPPRDVRVPWECTYIAYSSDQDDNTEGLGSLDLSEESDQYDSDNISMTSSLESNPQTLEGTWRDRYGNEFEIDADMLRGAFADGFLLGDGAEGVWRDEAGNEIEIDRSSQWSTDEEDKSTTSTDEEPNETSDEEDIVMTDTPSPGVGNIANGTALEADRSTMDGSIDTHTPNASEESRDDKEFSYANMFSSDAKKPDKFTVLEGSTPEDHHFSHRRDVIGGKGMRHIQKEHKMLRDSLPDGAYVRTWESNINMMRVLLLGPLETPYEYAPFVFDLYLDSSFPRNPPEVFFHSWTDGRGPCNPNLYEDGKVCLSLLGTWPGDEKNESWNPGTSSILQLIVSLLGLVLVKEPYYNEAGFEVRLGTVESQIPSAQYSERTYFRTRHFIAHSLEHPVSGFEKDITSLYLDTSGQLCPRLLSRAITSGIETIRRSRNLSPEDPSGPNERRVTAGALAPLTRQVERLLDILAQHDATEADALREALKGGA